MVIGEALLLALQLSTAANYILDRVQKAEAMNSNEIDLELNASEQRLIAELNSH